jgi:hypothetical protein
VLTSIHRYIISSYINCLREYIGDRELVDSMAFLISASEGLDLEYFSPDGDHVGYFGKLEDAKRSCSKYIEIFYPYDDKTIKSTAVKLWDYYAGKNVKFTVEERKMLSELGIRV